MVNLNFDFYKTKLNISLEKIVSFKPLSLNKIYLVKRKKKNVFFYLPCEKATKPISFHFIRNK